MLILVIIVIGLAAGWIAQVILGETRNWGLALATGLGGSLVGGLLVSLLAGDGLRIRPTGFLGSIVGAIILLAIVRAVRGRR